MKKTITILLCLLVLTACKKEKGVLDKIKDTTEKVSKTATGLKNTKSIVGGLAEAKALASKLKTQEPVSKEAWKVWIPEKLEDLDRTLYNLDKSIGKINTINLQFKSSTKTSKQFKMEIIDGAGVASGLAYKYKSEESLKLDVKNDKGYDKIHTRDGVTINEKYRKTKYSSHTEMKFLIDNRFMVDARAQNIEPDELWEYIKALEFKNLK